MSKHTKEPWESVEGDEAVEWHPDQESPHSDHGCSIESADGSTVCLGGKEDEQGGAYGFLKTADRDRAVACVNACAGLNPEAIPELVAAARYLRDSLDCDFGVSDARTRISDAIYKLEAE